MSRVMNIPAATPSRVAAWIMAARPKTLTISVTPVLVGSALAFVDSGRLAVDIVLATLIGAVLIQMATNLHNDAADHEAGADRPDRRLGPPRAAASGWIGARELQLGAAGCVVLAFAMGLYLATAGGWPIVVIGLAAVAAGWAYSSGPLPVSRTSLGELFVVVFFGIVAVAGTYYLQTSVVTSQVLLAGLYVGLPAGAVLVVNNHRDREEDARAGRRTLAIAVGEGATKWVYGGLLCAPFSLLSVLDGGRSFWWWLPLTVLPTALGLVRRLCILRIGRRLNSVLAHTAIVQLLLGVTLAAAWVLPLNAP